MKISYKFFIIIISIIFISRIFPYFWQVGITGVISFFLTYLITKINNTQPKKTNSFH